MAWPIQTKARAIAMMMLGNSVTATAADLNVPKQTISRWRADGRDIMRDYWERHPEGKWLMKLGQNLRKTGLKKRG